MSPTSVIRVNRHYLFLLRVSIGIIYLWFGVLKFFHGYSPAEDLAISTINKLCFGLIPQPVNIILLAIWECALGLLLIAGKWVRIALVFLFVFFTNVSFKYAPYGFTLVGQYIMKNIIIICAALVIWSGEK